jgi:hypothetical protein
MAIYPGAVATPQQLLVAGNSQQDTLSGAINSITTSLTLATSGRWSSGQAVVIDSEIILLGTVVGAAATGCTRGYDGTTAAAHASGAFVYGYIVAAHHNLLSNEIVALETALGANLGNLTAGVLSSTYNFTRSFSTVITTAGVYNFDFLSLPPGVSAYIFAPSYAVTGVVNNGSGLCRVTLSTPPTIETGAVVVITGVGGVTNANGTFVVTKISDYVFDLQNSTFAGVYTSGGSMQQRPQYLYLSGGTGTPEACPIISITSAVVSLYVALPKSGTYTITSATAGVQEAIYASQSRITVPFGFNQVAGPITIDGIFHPGVRLFGAAQSGCVFARRSSFTSGDVIRCINNTGVVLQDFAIYNVNLVIITAGAAISFANGNTFANYIQNISVTDERTGLQIAGFNTISCVSFSYFQTPNIVALGNYCDAGIVLKDAPWSTNGNLQFSNTTLQGIVAESSGTAYTNQLTYGFKVEQADGVQISNMHCKAKIGFIMLRANLTKTINYINVVNLETDGCRDYHIYSFADDYTYGQVVPGGTAGAFQNIKFTNVSAQAQLNATGQTVFIGGLGTGSAGIQFANCLLTSANKILVLLQTTSFVSFANCHFCNANQSNVAGGYSVLLSGSSVNKISFTGCRWDYDSAFGDFSYGIRATATQLNNFNFVGNQCLRSISQFFAINSGCTIKDSVINDNVFANATGFGIALEAGSTINGLSLVGNTFRSNGFGSFQIAGTVTRLALGPNDLQETAATSLASAATVTLPTDNFVSLVPITGTTTIDTINAAWNRRLIRIRTASALTLSIAGNIGRSITTVAGQVVTLEYDTTTSKWWPQ